MLYDFNLLCSTKGSNNNNTVEYRHIVIWSTVTYRRGFPYFRRWLYCIIIQF